jgi:hypothetical protein
MRRLARRLFLDEHSTLISHTHKALALVGGLEVFALSDEVGSLGLFLDGRHVGLFVVRQEIVDASGVDGRNGVLLQVKSRISSRRSHQKRSELGRT